MARSIAVVIGVLVCLSLTTVPVLAQTCGNGILNLGEECDDGNSINTDACSNQCTANICGNNRVDPGEECDNPSSTLCNPPYTSLPCQFPVCGDGLVTPGLEQCDDGNLNGMPAYTSCSRSCLILATGATRCGDGIVQNPDSELGNAQGGAEECDDGNNVDNDSCSNICTIVQCGNGRREANEQCDGADPPGVRCNAFCQIQPYFTAQLRDNLFQVDLSFLNTTISASLLTDCTSVIVSANTLFGAGHTCRVAGPNSIVITMSTSATLMTPTTTFTISNAALFPGSVLTDLPVSVQAAANPVAPVAHVEAPFEIPQCIADNGVSPLNDLVFDATGVSGSGGRQWKRFTWALSWATQGSDSFAQAVNVAIRACAFPCTYFTVPIGAMAGQAGTTTIVTLTVTNWAGVSSSVQLPVSVRPGSSSGMQLSRNGPNVALYAASLPLVLSETVANPCRLPLSPDAQSGVSWLQVRGSGSDYSRTTLQTSVLPAPPNTYLVGDYSLQAQGYRNLDLSAAVRDSVTLTLVESPLVARLDPGSRMIGAAQPIVLDARRSYDPQQRLADPNNFAPMGAIENSALHFTWSCIFLDQPSSGCVFASYLVQDSPVAVIPGSVAPPGTHLFQLVVSHDDGRVADPVSVQIEVLGTPLAEVTIELYAATQDSGFVGTYDVSSRISIPSVISPSAEGYAMRWTQVAPPLQGLPSQLLPAFPSNQTSLAFAPNTLAADTGYVFMLEAVNAAQVVVGRGSVSFQTSNGPLRVPGSTGGSCSFTTTDINPALDNLATVTIDCRGFELGEPTLGPLRYNYWFSVFDVTRVKTWTLVMGDTLDNHVTLLRPLGIVQVKVTIADGTGTSIVDSVGSGALSPVTVLGNLTISQNYLIFLQFFAENAILRGDRLYLINSLQLLAELVRETSNSRDVQFNFREYIINILVKDLATIFGPAGSNSGIASLAAVTNGILYSNNYAAVNGQEKLQKFISPELLADLAEWWTGVLESSVSTYFDDDTLGSLLAMVSNFFTVLNRMGNSKDVDIQATYGFANRMYAAINMHVYASGNAAVVPECVTVGGPSYESDISICPASVPTTQGDVVFDSSVSAVTWSLPSGALSDLYTSLTADEVKAYPSVNPAAATLGLLLGADMTSFAGLANPTGGSPQPSSRQSSIFGLSLQTAVGLGPSAKTNGGVPLSVTLKTQSDEAILIAVGLTQGTAAFCGFFDVKVNRWSTQGVKTVPTFEAPRSSSANTTAAAYSGTKLLVCASNHLTDFAAFGGSSLGGQSAFSTGGNDSFTVDAGVIILAALAGLGMGVIVIAVGFRLRTMEKINAVMGANRRAFAKAEAKKGVDDEEHGLKQLRSSGAVAEKDLVEVGDSDSDASVRLRRPTRRTDNVVVYVDDEIARDDSESERLVGSDRMDESSRRSSRDDYSD